MTSESVTTKDPPPGGNQTEEELPLSAEEVAERLGVPPTDSKASPKARKRAYWWFRQFLAISQLLDPLKIPNSFVNYQCVWWKAITGNDRSSSLQDGGLAYDLLPPITRLAVASPFASMYPRFHHGNVELRTKYLDTAMEQIVDSIPKHVKNIRLVLIGSGYDLRSLRMALRYPEYTMDLVELDLPEVKQAKHKIFQRRLSRRRPELKDLIHQVRMFAVDLNDLEKLASVLRTEVLGDKTTPCYTIFVFEAVLIYLDEGIPSKVFSVLSQALQKHGQSGALCFADTLSNVDESRESEAREELKHHGWVLQDWITKPGRTKHLGWAELATK